MKTQAPIESDLGVLHQLGKRIAYLREKKGLTLLQLSLVTGLSRSYITDLEHGRRNPSVDICRRVADGLEITLEELFRGISSID